jgi:hypothetical protein
MIIFKGRKKKTIEYVAVKSVEKNRKKKVLNEVIQFNFRCASSTILKTDTSSNFTTGMRLATISGSFSSIVLVVIFSNCSKQKRNYQRKPFRSLEETFVWGFTTFTLTESSTQTLSKIS